MKLGWYHDVARLDDVATESGKIGRSGFDGIPFSASSRTRPSDPPTWIDLDDDADRATRRAL